MKDETFYPRYEVDKTQSEKHDNMESWKYSTNLIVDEYFDGSDTVKKYKVPVSSTYEILVHRDSDGHAKNEGAIIRAMFTSLERFNGYCYDVSRMFTRLKGDYDHEELGSVPSKSNSDYSNSPEFILAEKID